MKFMYKPLRQILRDRVRRDTKRVWHEWFAWLPVCVKKSGYGETYIWLERVKRKREYLYGTSYFVYKYRYQRLLLDDNS